MLSEADLEQYRRDGVILVKGLLSGAELKAAQAESTRLLEAQKPTFPAYRLINFQGWRTSKAFRTVAMDSSAPGIAAQVMGLMDGEAHANGVAFGLGRMWVMHNNGQRRSAVQLVDLASGALQAVYPLGGRNCPS